MKEISKVIQEKLDKISYNDIEKQKEIFELAKQNNILIIYGSSDDLIELRGIVYDESGIVYNGYDFNLLEDNEDFNSDKNANEILKEIGCVAYSYGFAKNDFIQKDRCDNYDIPWCYDINEKFKNLDFNLLEDNEIFCIGKIIQYK
jgi:hypothetical protein